MSFANMLYHKCFYAYLIVNKIYVAFKISNTICVKEKEMPKFFQVLKNGKLKNFKRFKIRIQNNNI